LDQTSDFVSFSTVLQLKVRLVSGRVVRHRSATVGQYAL